MLYGVLSQCTALREITSGMSAFSGKLQHLGIKHYLPRRSTLSDANSRRPSKVFEAIYQKLYAHYRQHLSDSGKENEWLKRLLIFDSTTFSLFKDILKCVGRKNNNGKSKGGIKSHMTLIAAEAVPQLNWYSSAATHDHQFVSQVELLPGQIGVFDRAYNDYSVYASWTQQGSFFVTRQKENAVYESVSEIEIAADAPDGFIKDERIQCGYKKDGQPCLVQLRRIAFYDRPKDRTLVFLTNLFDADATTIGNIYRQRWKIELLFKQLKQNFPLQYFVGDNQNAIEIQIWCTLIANLLLTVIKRINKTKTAFSVLVSLVRLHLMNYTTLASLWLLKPVDRKKKIKPKQGLLFDS